MGQKCEIPSHLICVEEPRCVTAVAAAILTADSEVSYRLLFNGGHKKAFRGREGPADIAPDGAFSLRLLTPDTSTTKDVR